MPSSAYLVITALGLYDAEINAATVGDQVFAPGWTCYEKRVPFQRYDVLALLSVGENVIGVTLGDGWYCGHVAWMGRGIYGPQSCLRAALVIDNADGSQEVISTDATWKENTGPIVGNDLLMGEIFDARKALVGWSQSGYNDSGWQSAKKASPVLEPELCEPLVQPVRRIQTMPAQNAWDLYADGRRYRIFDFGQNFAGRIKLHILAAKGTQLRFRYGEMVTQEKTLYTENLRTAKSTDYYICNGNGSETWEPKFTFHGFRYVEVDITELNVSDSFEITGVVLHNDMEVTGQFECSNPLLNQLQHNILWGQKSNFLEAPTDCPQRDERLGWTGDAQVFIRTACFNMDVQRFFHKWMQDHRDSQGEIGNIPPVVPHFNMFNEIKNGGPAWSDATIICPWTIYLCYGDNQILMDHYESMCRYMNYLKEHASKDCIPSHPDLDFFPGFGDWLALDGGATVQGLTAYDLIGTAFYAYDAELMAKIASILGRTEDADKFHALRAQVVSAFQRRFVTPDGLLVSATQTAYVLALHFDLLPEHLRPIAAQELVRNIKNKEMHIGTGFVGTPYVLEVLENAGYLDVAYQLLEQESFPSWLFPVKNGATTIWERWDGWTPEKGFQDISMNSFNHYAYGAVGAWMYQTVAGLELDPNEPGYRHIIFRPRPGGSITWAKASLKTPQGLVSINWQLSESELKLEITIPEGSHASLEIPEGFTASEAEYSPGTYSLSLKKA